MKDASYSVHYLSLLQAVYKTTYEGQQMILADFFFVRAQSLGRRVQLVSTLNKLKEVTVPSQLRSTRVIRTSENENGDANQKSSSKKKSHVAKPIERSTAQLGASNLDGRESSHPRKSESNPIMIKIPKKSPMPKPK